MPHRTVIKGMRENFHENLITAGKKPLFVPLSAIEEWVESFGTQNELSEIETGEYCDQCLFNEGMYRCFKYTGKSTGKFPVHYHDKQETFKVINGKLVLEFIDQDGSYSKVSLSAGDQLTMKAGAIHKGRIIEDLVAHLSFKI